MSAEPINYNLIRTDQWAFTDRECVEFPEGYSGKPYNVKIPSVEASCQAIWLALAKRRALEGDFSGASSASVNVSALRASKAVESHWERERRARR